MKIKNTLSFMALLLVAGIAIAKPKKQGAPQTPVIEQPTKPATIVEAFGKLAQNLVAQASNKPTFAFMALNSDDGNALIENYITDALTEAMFATGKIKVVERASLEKIMSEQKFQSSAFINENTAAEIGNLSGANFVCYGTLKDLQSHISVNVRVVEVSTAELYAMSRDTVEKDAYLANVGFEARKESLLITGLGKSSNSGSPEKTGSATNATNSNPAPVSKSKVDSLWQVTQKDNVYTFVLKSSSEPFLFFGYNKNENPASSFVRAGIHWRKAIHSWESRPSSGTYDIKEESGNIIKGKSYGWSTWSFNGEDLAYTRNTGESARFFVDLFGNNKVLALRHGNESFRFQSEGFWQAVEEQGLTREEIYDAIANEEF